MPWINNRLRALARGPLLAEAVRVQNAVLKQHLQYMQQSVRDIMKEMNNVR